MKLRVWLVMVILVFYLSFSFGQQIATVTGGVVAAIEPSTGDDIALLEGTKVPWALRYIAGDERINANIRLESEDVITLGVVTEEGVVTDAQFGPIMNATLLFYIPETAIRRIQTSRKPLTEFSAAVKSGEIQYAAVGFKNKVKYGGVSLLTRGVLWARSWFD